MTSWRDHHVIGFKVSTVIPSLNRDTVVVAAYQRYNLKKVNGRQIRKIVPFGFLFFPLFEHLRNALSKVHKISNVIAV